MDCDEEHQGLVVVGRLAACERLMEEALRDAVRHARAEGCSWQAIGEALGTTRQAAHGRFRRHGVR